MNYRWRVIIIVAIVLIIWSIVRFLYIQNEERSAKTDKVKISVHYEALCPDSKYFIVHHLLPTYKKLPDYIILDLIPYGKAQTIETDGMLTFQCQHEELECYANKIHACVLDLVADPSTQLSYIACMIKSNQNPEAIGKTCGDELKIDFDPILTCAKEEKGSQLLKKHGERTHGLKPSVSFIPTIELNNRQDWIAQSSILKNLQNVICGLIKTRPTECDT